MTHPLEPLRARADFLVRVFAYALAHLAHPGLARLRRALSKLEDQFRLWLITMIYRAPEGMFGGDPAPQTPRVQKPKSPPPPQPWNERKRLSIRFRLSIAAPRATPAPRAADYSSRPTPTELEKLHALNARLMGLIIALKDPSRELNRLGRLLARRPLVDIGTRRDWAAPATSSASAQTTPRPEPHKRE